MPPLIPENLISSPCLPEFAKQRNSLCFLHLALSPVCVGPESELSEQPERGFACFSGSRKFELKGLRMLRFCVWSQFFRAGSPVLCCLDQTVHFRQFHLRMGPRERPDGAGPVVPGPYQTVGAFLELPTVERHSTRFPQESSETRQYLRTPALANLSKSTNASLLEFCTSLENQISGLSLFAQRRLKLEN